MPDTLSQTNAIYAKAARSAALRRARLLREKALRKHQRLQVRIRDRTIVNEHFNQQQSNTVLSLAASFCRACCGFFILYLGIVLLYYYGVHLLRRYQ